MRFKVACAAVMLSVTLASFSTKYTPCFEPSVPGITASPGVTMTAIDGEPVCVTTKLLAVSTFTPPRVMSELRLTFPALNTLNQLRICSAVCVAPAFCRNPGGLTTAIYRTSKQIQMQNQQDYQDQ